MQYFESKNVSSTKFLKLGKQPKTIVSQIDEAVMLVTSLAWGNAPKRARRWRQKKKQQLHLKTENKNNILSSSGLNKNDSFYVMCRKQVVPIFENIHLEPHKLLCV